VLFVAAGVMHFLSPEMYTAIVPPFLPAPRLLVYISGVAELVLGTTVVIPATRRAAAWGLIALLLAVYPANLYHAFSGGLADPRLPEIFESALFAWLRAPLQFVLIAWAWRYTRPRSVGGAETGGDLGTS